VSGAGGTGAAGGVGGGAGGAGGGGAGGAPTASARVFAATSNGVAIWNNIATASGTTAPDTTLGGFSGQALVLVSSGTRLAVYNDARSIYLYDNPATLSAASTPVAIIPATALTGGGAALFSQGASSIVGSNFFLGYGNGRFALFRNFATLSASSLPSAEFTHVNEQLTSASYEPTSDRLFASQVSGSGVVIFTAVSAASGPVTPAAQLSPLSIWGSCIGANSLYGASDAAVHVWRGISTKPAGSAPDATLSDGVSGALYVAIDNDTLAVSEFTDVLLYSGAGSLTTGAHPSKTIATGSGLSAPAKLVRGELFAPHAGGIGIYSTPLATASLRATLTVTGTLKDLLVLP